LFPALESSSSTFPELWYPASASVIFPESTHDVFVPLNQPQTSRTLSTIHQGSLAKAGSGWMIVHLDLGGETYALLLPARLFLTGAFVVRALCLAIFWRPALFTAVCLLRAMAALAVLSGLQLDLEVCTLLAFSTGTFLTGRRSVQESPQIRSSEVAEQHVPGM
jgi:hypothetical protein